jgi:hypothetical protein
VAQAVEDLALQAQSLEFKSHPTKKRTFKLIYPRILILSSQLDPCVKLKSGKQGRVEADE